MDKIDYLIRDLCEIPDRNSPDDQPEMLLVTAAEIRSAIDRWIGADIRVCRDTLMDHVVTHGMQGGWLHEEAQRLDALVTAKIMPLATTEMNMDIGSEVMLGYLQIWGQSVEKKIATLNKAAKAAGLRAEWRQDADGKNAGWYGPDCDKAAEFKKRLHQVWRGEFNAEARAVEELIAEFAANAQEA